MFLAAMAQHVEQLSHPNVVGETTDLRHVSNRVAIHAVAVNAFSADEYFSVFRNHQTQQTLDELGHRTESYM